GSLARSETPVRRARLGYAGKPMISADTPLVLGSQSPRRSEILRGLGIPIRVCPAQVDEAERPGESPTDYVRRVTVSKFDAVAARLTGGDAQAEGPWGALVTADTSVVLDGEILGKPVDTADALRLLRRI